MDFTLFMVFSSIESLGLFALTLTIFRFNIINYWRQVVFASLMLTIFSYILRFLLDEQGLVPLILLLIAIILVWFLFDIKIYYAALMVTIGYLTVALFQTVLLYLFQFTGVFTVADMVKKETYQGYLLQFLTSSILCAMSYLFYKWGWGFSFSFQTHLLKKHNVLNMLVVFLSILSNGFTFFFFFKGYIDLYIFSLVLIITILGLLLILLIRKEKKND